MNLAWSATGRRCGSTLAELLIAISILALLAGITLVALNPKKNQENAADAKRREHLQTMIDALYQYQIDHGEFPHIPTYRSVDKKHRDVCALTSVVPNELFFCILDAPQRIPLGQLIPDYLPALPKDPKNEEQYETGYQLWLDADGRVHASAPLGKGGLGIEMAR